MNALTAARWSPTMKRIIVAVLIVAALGMLRNVLTLISFFTVGPDEVVVTLRTDRAIALTTTAGDREVTTTGPYHAARITGLEPETEYPLAVDGAEATALLPGRVTTCTACRPGIRSM